MADIQCVFESMTDKGSIYISNLKAAENLTLLQSRGIKAIVSMARSGYVQHNKEDIPYYLYIPAEDHEQYQIYRHFNKTYDFIDQARKQTNVLVHCMVGVSRSVTIVMAYLLKKYKASLSDVIAILQRKRKKINPNKGFIQQLKKYAQEEGLKCDFQGISVPTIRQRPHSAQKRKETVQSQSKENQISGNINPCFKPIRFKDKGETLAGKTANINAAEKQRSNRIQIKSQRKNEKSTQNIKFEVYYDKKLDLSKKKSVEKRQVSIEQKINKVREKMKRQQGYFSRPKSSLGKQCAEGNCIENKQLKEQKGEKYEGQTSKKLQNYLTIYRNSNKITQLITINRKQNTTSENKLNPKPSIQGFNSCELNQSTLYTKASLILMKPRKIYGRVDH